jgi:predicted kinase
MHRLTRTPALRRLEFLLDGLDGVAGWDAHVGAALAPEFLARVPVEKYVSVVRDRSHRYAPVSLVGIDAGERTARARLRNGAGEIDVLTCVVEPDPPHRVMTTWLQGLVPAGLTARLPTDFEGYELPTAATSLIVFSGVPGSGKSTLAEEVGRALGIPVFAMDWLLGALTPFGGRHLDDQFGIANELATTLTVRQLSLGQSAILDAPFEDIATRDRLRSLAGRAGARFTVVLCVCSDPTLHRGRLEGRGHAIPGWHDAGDWADVCRRLAAFPAWDGEVLTVDAVNPLAENLASTLDHINAG